MFKTYSSSSLVITSRWFATSRMVAPVSVRLVYWIALQILEMTQSSTFMKHWKFPLSRTWNTKRWPPNYDVMIWWRSPRHAPHIWGRRRRWRCVFDLQYACMCKHARGSKLSSSCDTWYEGEKSDGHTMFSFVLNLKFYWSIGDGRAHR